VTSWRLVAGRLTSGAAELIRLPLALSAASDPSAAFQWVSQRLPRGSTGSLPTLYCDTSERWSRRCLAVELFHTTCFPFGACSSGG
jgi:hypothetical protein